MADSQPPAPQAPGEPKLEVFQPVERPQGDVWIDLLNPDEHDLRRARESCGLRIPSREDLSEIESSSRHYVENGALYLSAPLVTNADSAEPQLTPVGFIVTRERLVTVHFDKLRAFDQAAQQIRAEPPSTGLEAFVTVVEAVVDRKADILEQLGAELEKLSHEVFRRPERKRQDSAAMRQLLNRVGQMGDRGSKMRASLVTLGRILPFVVDTAGGSLPPALAARLSSAREDVASLTGYQENLANKVQFLLDAALGFINIDQNDVFKILTVVSAVGVPPTLVASIYGMNFKIMPELQWTYGYPYAIALMVLTTVLPLWWFRRKGWF